MKFSPQQRKILILIVIGIFILIGLNLFPQEAKNFFYLVSEPIQKFLWKSGQNIVGFGNVIFEMQEVKKKDEELLLINQQLRSEIAILQTLKAENEVLRKALDIGLKEDFQLAFAEVIGKDVSQDSLLINKGLKDGISQGMPVINEGKILIGKIVEPTENFSKVLLISNQNSSFDAEIPGKDIRGVVKGRGNSQVILDLIPEGKEIKEGDLITTISLGGIFPEGILVGTIQAARRSDVKAFQQAEILPLFDVGKLGKVFIIQNSR